MANRWVDFAQMPISEEQRLALLENQFELQDTHFRNYFPFTERRIVISDRKPVGRIYLDRGPEIWRLIDISLLPEVTGHGIGGALFDTMLAEADAAGQAITLHCSLTNRAHSLYQRKGFVDVRQEAMDWIMERQPQAPVS